VSYEALLDQVYRPQMYASLASSVDTFDDATRSLQARCGESATAAMNLVRFLDVEITLEVDDYGTVTAAATVGQPPPRPVHAHVARRQRRPLAPNAARSATAHAAPSLPRACPCTTQPQPSGATGMSA